VHPECRAVVFDPVQDLYGAKADPDLFLETFAAPLILDEVQYVPELLSAMKRRVDLSEARGQYFLTGSQNLSVLRGVAESLAGRIGVLRLDGMTPAELCGCGGDVSWVQRFLESPGSWVENITGLDLLPALPSLPEFLWRGQMPGLIGVATEDVSAFWSSYVQTYVERDVRLMMNVADLAIFGRFLKLCGAMTAREVVQSQFGRELGVNPKTARHWLDVLAHSYQWVELPPYCGNTIKRLSGKTKGHVLDSGLASYWHAVPSPGSLLAHPAFGNIFESWGVAWIMCQCQRMPLAPTVYHWRTGNGAEVDAVLEYDGRLFPMEFKASARLSAHDARSIMAFRSTYANAGPGVIVYGGDQPFRLNREVVAVPWRAV